MFGADDKSAAARVSLTTVFTPETREIFTQELVALAEGHTTFEAESVLRTLHGDRVDVLVSITFPIAGEPADSVLVTLTDITLQKHAEQARRDSEALFHEMADTAPAMLWISDRIRRMDVLEPAMVRAHRSGRRRTRSASAG